MINSTHFLTCLQQQMIQIIEENVLRCKEHVNTN